MLFMIYDDASAVYSVNMQRVVSVARADPTRGDTCECPMLDASSSHALPRSIW